MYKLVKIKPGKYAFPKIGKVTFQELIPDPVAAGLIKKGLGDYLEKLPEKSDSFPSPPQDSKTTRKGSK